MEIRVDEVEASATASVLGPKDLARIIERFDTVYAFLRSRPDIRQIGQNVILYDRDRMDVGVEVDRTFESDGLVTPSSLPAGRIAHATHTGGFGTVGETYDAVRAWCDDNGHRRSGIEWEVYGDPDDDGHVDVEICCLLA
jgi:effector-binding domain-containing protein